MVKGSGGTQVICSLLRLVLHSSKNEFTEFNTFKLLSTVFSGRGVTAQGKIKMEKYCPTQKLQVEFRVSKKTLNGKIPTQLAAQIWFNVSFAFSFNQQMFTEHLVCVRPGPRCWRWGNEQNCEELQRV